MGRSRGSWCCAWKAMLRGVCFFFIVEVAPLLRKGASSSSVSPPTLPLLSLVKIMMLPGAARVVEDVVPPPSGATAANPTGEGVRCRW